MIRPANQLVFVIIITSEFRRETGPRQEGPVSFYSIKNNRVRKVSFPGQKIENNLKYEHEITTIIETSNITETFCFITQKRLQAKNMEKGT